ncbi:UPF0481 protein, partial [Trifolium medium]|nr:UPF0481 protein [Trifolium medium]
MKMKSDDVSWMVPIEVMLGSLNHGEVQACSISAFQTNFEKQTKMLTNQNISPLDLLKVALKTRKTR